MSRRRRHKKQKKDDPLIGVVFIIIGLATLYSFQETGSITDLGTLLKNAFVTFVVIGVIVLAGYLVFKWVRNGFDILGRKQLYRQYRSIGEVLTMHPKDFENFVAAVYEHDGYTIDQVTSYSRDHGIDVLLSKDGKRYAMQVKRYAQKNYVKAREIREFYGSYVGGGFDGGIFVTTSSFGRQAYFWGKERGIELVTGQQLLKMMNTYEKITH